MVLRREVVVRHARKKVIELKIRNYGISNNKVPSCSLLKSKKQSVCYFRFSALSFKNLTCRISEMKSNKPHLDPSWAEKVSKERNVIKKQKDTKMPGNIIKSIFSHFEKNNLCI